MIKNNKGFTLLEVLLVVSLLGIILAITIPNIGAGSSKANTELCASTKLIVQAAAEQYVALEKEEIILKDGQNIVNFLQKADYLRHELECPNGGTYEYKDGKVTCNKCEDDLEQP